MFRHGIITRRNMAMVVFAWTIATCAVYFGGHALGLGEDAPALSRGDGPVAVRDDGPPATEAGGGSAANVLGSEGREEERR